ncbi:MAG: hypothetical protein Tp1111DCM1126091_64 [Prokaryotic dsDNA virus sp.]|nr:MAG: hypothetical protein Tp1111DCM1126091_64 [Prokaryotic dsDNA virus sp.]
MTKTQQRILEAVERGYRVTEEGVLFGPKGVINVRLSGKQRYPTFSTNWGYVFGIPVHRFAAYCFYGEDAFNPSLVVRHLDANTLNFSKENIILGTHSENNLDKPGDSRVESAKAARKSQGYTPVNAKLDKEQVDVVREFYKKLDGKKAPNGAVKELCDRLGVTRTVLIKIKNGEYYAKT